MEYGCFQHVDSYIEVTVEAGNEEEAEHLARVALQNMSSEEFARQVVANSEVDSEVNFC